MEFGFGARQHHQGKLVVTSSWRFHAWASLTRSLGWLVLFVASDVASFSTGSEFEWRTPARQLDMALYCARRRGRRASCASSQNWAGERLQLRSTDTRASSAT